MLRRRSTTDGGDYDSVLDTMTNVVGILIIVVAVTQLNVSSAVGRARTAMVEAGDVVDHPPVSEEALETARRERDAAKQRLGELQAASSGGGAGEGVSEEEWADLKRKFKRLPPPEAIPPLKREIRQSEAELERIREEIRRLDAAMVRTLSRIQALEAQLEALKGRKIEAAPPVRMRLPDPGGVDTRELTLEFFFVKGGRAYRWDTRALMEKARADMQIAAARTPSSARDARSRLEWIAGILNRNRYTNGTCRLRFEVVPPSTLGGDWDLREIEDLAPDARGSSLAEVRAATSSFHEELSRLTPRRHWVFFHVSEDSFETYLVARTLTEDRGFAVGWEAYSDLQRLERSLLAPGRGQPVEAD